MAANLYAPPAARVADVAANPEAEALRRAHLGHEASVKAVGFLYYLLGVVLIAVDAAWLAGVELPNYSVTMMAAFLVFGMAQLFTGWGVRALRRWARIVGTIFSAIGLLNFPVGTLINLYILYLFWSKKGRMVFSAPYQEAIAATPDIKYRTSMVVWILLALLVLVIAVAVFATLSGR
jgi:hypothetical protein